MDLSSSSAAVGPGHPIGTQPAGRRRGSHVEGKSAAAVASRVRRRVDPAAFDPGQQLLDTDSAPIGRGDARIFGPFAIGSGPLVDDARTRSAREHLAADSGALGPGEVRATCPTALASGHVAEEARAGLRAGEEWLSEHPGAVGLGALDDGDPAELWPGVEVLQRRRGPVAFGPGRRVDRELGGLRAGSSEGGNMTVFEPFRGDRARADAVTRVFWKVDEACPIDWAEWS